MKGEKVRGVGETLHFMNAVFFLLLIPCPVPHLDQTVTFLQTISSNWMRLQTIYILRWKRARNWIFGKFTCVLTFLSVPLCSTVGNMRFCLCVCLLSLSVIYVSSFVLTRGQGVNLFAPVDVVISFSVGRWQFWCIIGYFRMQQNYMYIHTSSLAL